MGDSVPPRPGPEHQRLRRLTGAWTARIKYFPGPGLPAQEANGEFLARMDMGGLFLCRDVNYGLKGFQGRGITGWDADKGHYAGVWLDTGSPLLHPTVGHFDERGVYCETSDGPDENGKIVRMKMTTEVVDEKANEMLFRVVTVGDDGAETLVVEIAHTRRRFVD